VTGQVLLPNIITKLKQNKTALVRIETPISTRQNENEPASPKIAMIAPLAAPVRCVPVPLVRTQCKQQPDYSSYS
jgi:hypothetical protein